jgi:hypothetical protein
MQQFTTIEACARGIIAFLIASAGKLPAPAQLALQNAQSSSNQIHVVMSTIEALWAYRDSLEDDGRMLVVALVQFAMPFDWYLIAQDNRGGRMQLAMMRDSGMEASPGFPWPDPSDDPEVAYQYRQPIVTTPANINPFPAPVEETQLGEDGTLPAGTQAGPTP